MGKEYLNAFLSGLIAACTSLASVMANSPEGGAVTITDTMIITTSVAFLVHCAKELKRSLGFSVDNTDTKGVDHGRRAHKTDKT